MLWSDIFPYVMPYLPGCPQPTAEIHIKLAAIEFCRRTLCWQKTLDPVISNGIDNLVDLETDPSTQIVKIKSVSVGGSDWSLTDSSVGLALIRSGSQESFCFTQDNLTLQVQPVQVAGVEIVVDVALAPSITANSIPNEISNAYVQDIAKGAVDSLTRLPNTEWSDVAVSQMYQQMFNNRIATVSSKVGRGFVNKKMNRHSSFF